MNLNTISRLLICNIEKSDWQKEDINLEFRLYEQLKAIVSQREDDLESDLLRRYQVLKWNYDFDVYLSNQPIVSKRKMPNTKRVKRQKFDSRNLFLDAVFHYKKFEYRTADLVPTLKVCIGEGCNGKVFPLNREKLTLTNPNSPLLKIEKELVVKKTSIDSYEEFRIGYDLSHKNLAKSYFYFTKEYHSKNVNKIVMERINGTILKEINKLDIEPVHRYLNDIKDCCLYLFDQGYSWMDRHSDNVIIESQSGQLKFIDFDNWTKDDNPSILYKNSISAISELVEDIIKKSTLRTKAVSIVNNQTIFSIDDNYSKIEAREKLESAFDNMIKNLEAASRDPSLFPDDENEESSFDESDSE